MTLTRAPSVEKVDGEIEVPFKEARRRRRRRNAAIAGIVVVVLVAATITAVSFRRHRTPAPGAGAGSPPRSVPSRVAEASTAFVWDASGLVPVDLAADSVGSPIPISELSTTWPNVVAVPGATTAYVLALPTPATAGVDEAGPSLVPVDLVSRTAQTPIPFRATAVESQAVVGRSPAVPPSFDIEGLAITPNGRTVLVADAADSTIIPIDVPSGRVGSPIPLPYERPFNSLIASVAEGPPSSRSSPPRSMTSWSTLREPRPT